MKSISKEIKENILNEIKNGGEVKAISIKYGVARSTVNSWLLDEEIVNSDKVLYKHDYYTTLFCRFTYFIKKANN